MGLLHKKWQRPEVLNFIYVLYGNVEFAKQINRDTIVRHQWHVQIENHTSAVRMRSTQLRYKKKTYYQVFYHYALGRTTLYHPQLGTPDF